MTDQKYTPKKARENFNLHVMLIMHQDGLSKADAQGRAYMEGVAGLTSRAQGTAKS